MGWKGSEILRLGLDCFDTVCKSIFRKTVRREDVAVEEGGGNDEKITGILDHVKGQLQHLSVPMRTDL